VPGLAPALPGERVMCGDVCCYVDGHGPPLLLVHTINAVSSAAEMRPLYEHYRASHTVFCPDLPGFGLSTRSDREYSPRLFTDAVHMVATLARERCGNQPIDAVAASLGCEFLARAAVEHPAAWGRLAFVSPTGLSGTGKRRGVTGSTRAIPGMHRLLSVPLWANALYRNLTRPAVIRYFLGRTWGGKAIDETLWAYGVQTARQPGARFAPLYFLSGGLFSADIHRIYEALAQPVWMSHGTRGDFSDFRGLSRLHDPGRWQRTVFQTGALPYFEQPAAFCAAFDAFLADNTPPSTAAPN
jgi:pimeloyl-ACP methyl ester carboxylesterase